MGRAKHWSRGLQLSFWLRWWNRQPDWRARVGAAMMPLGLKSQSDLHGTSAVAGEHTSGRPIIILGSPRGSTTTMMRRVARVAGRPFVFEPIGFNDLGLASHAAANHYFRLGISTEEHEGLFVDGVPPHAFHALPECGRGSAPREALLAHVQALHESVGTGCVWKEVRLMPALTGLLDVYEQIGLSPQVFLVRSHPLGVLYSYYRMLALRFGRGVHGKSVGQLLSIRRRCYQYSLPESRWLQVPVRTPGAALVAAVALDQEAIQHWGEEGVLGRTVSLLTSDDDLRAAMGDEDRTGLAQIPVDPAIASWARDPIFLARLPELIGEECLQLVTEQFGSLPLPPQGAPSWRQRMTGWLQWANSEVLDG